jgi:hypothetical protein
MINCGNCGQQNPEGDHFCRRCGMGLRPAPQRQEIGRDFEQTPPRPYSWSTGEFPPDKPARRGARDTRQIEIGRGLDDPFQTSEYPARRGHGPMVSVYRCPYCGSTSLPIVTKRVSTTGWVVFSVLLVLTLFLFWIGLLLQEEVRVCPSCNRQIN